MANFTYHLTDLNIRYYEPLQPLEVEFIEGATGTYTVSVFLTSVGYYLQDVTGGKRISPLSKGDQIIASGKNADGQTIWTHGMVCTDPGDPASFRYPPAA